MPKKTTPAETDEFSITLPKQAIEMIYQLIPTGLFGTSRGEVARNLILDRLKQLASEKLIRLRRPKD